MPMVISFVSQKGGVGKSTLARAVAAFLAGAGFSVRIADLDIQQETSLAWYEDRKAANIKPDLNVKTYNSCKEALADSMDVQVLVIDGAARADLDTLEIAAGSHLVVQPSSGTKDDYKPADALFSLLAEKGIPKERLIIALSRITAVSEEKEARAFFKDKGHRVLEGAVYSRRSYGVAMNEGHTISETIFDSLNERTSQLLDELAGVVMELLEDEATPKKTKPKRKATAKKSTKSKKVA